jgi:NitT/TauT family transport system ATP-binding protein
MIMRLISLDWNKVMEEKKIIEITDVNFEYNDQKNNIKILENINIEIRENEIVGILGRSGAGKSTLLRIVAGLLKPSSGKILYYGNDLEYTEHKMAMVFQNIALVPWLNVYENVSLGLESKKLPKHIHEDEVNDAIDIVGLDGYEYSYPKEISNGMRQRAGLARALAIDPEVLLLDSPFSSLDYITKDALQADLLDLWFKRYSLPLEAILLVTHNIEETVSLCDRVLIMSSNPGRIVEEIKINIPHPRDPHSKEFQGLVSKIYLAMTTNSKLTAASEENRHKYYPQTISVKPLIHFLVTIRGDEVENNNTTIAKITEDLHLSSNQILILVECLVLLKFIKVSGDKITLTASGQIMIEADDAAQKVIFREHFVRNVQFASDLYSKLRKAKTNGISKDIVLKILEKTFTEREAKKILDATISWAIYADLFIYDHQLERLIISKNK